jgi:Inorganic pyrophosphatase
MKEVHRFFEDYKKLENKEVKVEDFLGKEDAIRIINESIELYDKHFSKSTITKGLSNQAFLFLISF